MVASRFEAQWMQDVLSSVLTPYAGEIREVSEPEPSAQREPEEEEEWVLSQWTLAHFCCEEVRTMLRGAWSRQRKEACQAALLRYVRSRKRKRGHRFDFATGLASRALYPLSRLLDSLSPRLWRLPPQLPRPFFPRKRFAQSSMS